MSRFLRGLVLVVVALPALAVTAARLSQLEDGPAVRLEAVTPLGIVLYAVGLLLALGWLIRSPGARRIPGAVALAAAAGLLLHLAWFSPLVLGATPKPAAGAAVITVMNSNLFEGHGDGIDIVREADRSGVDVLVLEEVTPSIVTLLEKSGIDDLLPYHAGGPRPNPDDDVAGTMVFSDLPLTQVVPLHTEFDAYRMQVGVGDDAFSLLAVHPTAPLDTHLWKQDFGVIDDVVRSEHPDLVVGDFNSTLDHPTLRTLLGLGLRDAAEEANSGFQPTWPSNGLGVGLTRLLPPIIQIDHVLVGDRYTAIGTRTVDIPRTDHRSLIADVARR